MSYRSNRPLSIMAAVLLSAISLTFLSGAPIPRDDRKLDPALSVSAEREENSGVLRRLTGLFRAPGRHELFIRARTDDASIPDRIAALGGTATRVAPGIFAGEIPQEAISAVSNWESVAYLEKSRRARKMLDAGNPAILADQVHEGPSNGLPLPFTGRNVTVGIVDTGLTSGHLDFSVDGGVADRVLHRFAAAGRNAATDVEWHGTHVAGIAAGNGRSSTGQFTGIAPDAFLSNYRTNFTFTDILNGISTLISQATIDSTPIALNLSLGTSVGPHDGSSAFESTVNSLATGPAGSRRIISVAAGNEATEGEHARMIVPPFGTSAALRVSVSSSLDPSFPPEIDIWADGRINDPDPARRVEYDEYSVTALFGGETVIAPSGTSVSSPSQRITVSNRTDTNVSNGATHILVSLSTALAGQTGTITLRRTRNGGNGVVDAYSDAIDSHFPDFTGTSAGSIIEPGNADNVVTVAAFNVRPSVFGGVGSLSSFSSAGPTRDGRNKPDVSAPGAAIRSARSRDAFDTSTGVQPEILSANDNYAILSGTSMAAPHLTGTAALVWESNINLTGAQMRERLRRTSDPVGASPNNSWGFGKVNALRAVSETVASITAPTRGLPGVPVPLSSSNSSGAYGFPLSFNWILSDRPAGSASVLSSIQAQASFMPDLPGIYTVSLAASQAEPAGHPADAATASIRVNTVPSSVSISGALSAPEAVSVPFTASGNDADGQPLSWRWILVSRPSGSAATLSPSGDQAFLSPDLAGIYTIGVRADDGLDNSALVTRSFTLGSSTPPPAVPPAPAASGGGGGCSTLHSGASGLPAEGWIILLSASLPALFRRLRKMQRARRESYRHPFC